MKEFIPLHIHCAFSIFWSLLTIDTKTQTQIVDRIIVFYARSPLGICSENMQMFVVNYFSNINLAIIF